MRFKFKLLLSTLVFLSACQTRLSFEGRRYTKGLYWNITSSPHTKKQKSNIQNTIVVPAKFKPSDPHLSIYSSNNNINTLASHTILWQDYGFKNLINNNNVLKPKINLKHTTFKLKQNANVLKHRPVIIKYLKQNSNTNDNPALTVLVLLSLLALDIILGFLIYWVGMFYFFYRFTILLAILIGLITLGLACTYYLIINFVELFKIILKS
ncbi:MAG: hypothetical protein ACK46W_10615 [Bacteroidota bacterium]